MIEKFTLNYQNKYVRIIKYCLFLHRKILNIKLKKSKIMKKILFIGFTLISVLIFSSCGKDDVSPEEQEKITKVEFTVLNSAGNPAANATVSLYKNETDFNSKSNAVQTKISDANGIALFDNLEPLKYYFYAEKDCQNNLNSGVVFVNPIVEGVTTTANILMTEAESTIHVSSYFDEAYKVYVNNVYKGDIVAYGDKYITVESGSYSIKLVQIDYIFYADEYTQSTNVSCGNEVTLEFR